MDKWALITGASSGIGRALAGVLAEKGWNLYLVARSTDKLVDLADSLPNIKATPISIDLAKKDAGQAVYAAVQKHGRMPQLLVNNAGVGYIGPVCKESPQEAEAMMQLNMNTLVKLSMLFLPHLIELEKSHKQCGILNLASIAMAFAIPYMAIYAASKAFVNSFTLALAQEHPSLYITSVCPGPVATNFGPIASKDFMPHSHHRSSAEEIAEHAYELWLDKRHLAIFSLPVKFLNLLSHLLPRRLAAWISSIVVTQNRNKKRTIKN